MTKKQIKNFFDELDGKNGCNFRIDEKSGQTIWNCAGGNSKDISRRILVRMGLGKNEITNFLIKCNDFGGYCDCEIIFNARRRILNGGKK